MALSKEQLTVQVELDSRGVLKNFKVLNSEIDSFNQSAKSASNSTNKAAQSFDAFTIKINDNRRALVQSEKELSIYERAVEQLQNQIADVAKDLSIALGSVAVSMSVLAVDAIPRMIEGVLSTADATEKTINNLSLMTRELKSASFATASMSNQISQSGLKIINKEITQTIPRYKELANAVTTATDNISVSFQMTRAAHLSFVQTVKVMSREILEQYQLINKQGNIFVTGLAYSFNQLTNAFKKSQIIEPLSKAFEQTSDVVKSSGLAASLKELGDDIAYRFKEISKITKIAADDISLSLLMARAANLSFRDTVKIMSNEVSSQYDVVNKKGNALLLGLSHSFTGISNSWKTLTTNLKSIDFVKALSESNLSSITDKLQNSLGALVSSVRNVSLVFFDIAKDIPNSMNVIKNAFAALPNITRGFIDFGKFLVQENINTSLLTMAESSLVLKNGLIFLGSTLVGQENAFAKFAGTIAIVSGILLGGFAYAVKMALTYVGELIASIGTSLINSMTKMEEKFQKAEVTITNFNYTIAGMNREFGNSAGTLETWTSLVNKISSSTIISATSARQMATEIMAVGHGLGLTQTQMEDLIQLIPNYVKAGDNAFDVTVSFLQALGGAPQGLLKYAVHLSDAGVEHSKFAKSSNIVMGALTEEQKVQARFNALMEQAAPIMGRANIQLATIAGSTQLYTNSLAEVQAKIGSQTNLITKLNVVMANLLKQVEKLPDAFFYTIGVMQDVGGIALYVLGNFIAWALPISATITLLAAFNSMLNTNAFGQALVTKALTVTNVALGGQAIAVTSAATAWAGLGTLLKSVAISAITGIGHAITGAASAVYAFTASLLTNPLFYKAAAIVAGIVLVVAALKRIEEETQIFSQLLTTIAVPFKNLINYFSEGGAAGSKFANIIGTVVSKAVDVAVIAVAAIINGVYTLIYAFNQLAAGIAAPWNALADALKLPKIEIFDQAANQAYQTMEKLSGTMGKAASNLFDFGNTAQASTKGMDDLTRGAKEARDALAGLSKELITANEKSLILAQTQGNQAAVLLASKAVALDKMKMAKEYSEKQNLAKELFQLDAQIAQFPVEALQDAQKAYADLQVSDLEQLNTVASIRRAGALKAQQALEPLRERIKELKLLPPTEQTTKALDQLKAVVSKTQTAINTDTEKKVVDLNNARLQAEFSARETLAKLMGDNAALAQVTYEKEVQSYKKMLDDKLISAEQFQAAEKKLREVRDTPKPDEKAKAAEGQQVKIAQDMMSAAASGADAVVGNAITQIGKAFGPEGQIIAGAINLLRMGGEQMKNLGQELIKIIYELPLMLAEGVVGLVEGLLQGVIDMLADPARLAKIITSLMNIVPKIITTFAKAIPQLLKLLLDPMFWIELASQIVRSLWDAFIEMWTAIGDMFADIFSGDIFGGVDEATKDMGKTVDAGIRYATNALTGVSDQMFGVMEDTAKQGQRAGAGKGGGAAEAEGKKKKEANWFQKYIIEPLARVVNFIWEGITNGAEYIWGILEPAIGFLMNAIVVPIQIAMELVLATFDIVGKVLTTTWKAIVAYFKGAWDVLMATFKAVWNVGVALFKGVIDIFKTVFEAVANVFKGIWEFAKSIFDVIIKTFRALWDFVAGIFDDPIAAFEKLWDDLKNIVSDLWDSITELGTVLWDAIKSIGTAIWDALKGVGEAIWEGLKSVGSKIWDMFKGVGEAIWEGIKNIGSRIGESLSNVGNYLWDGIKGAFENVKSFFKGLFSFDGGGTGAVEDFLDFDFPWLAFAEGGKVPGTPKVFGDSLKNDTVAALLSPGEYVIPRSKMQDPMNLMMIDAIMSGGMMRDWIEQGMSGGVQKKGYGEWIEKASNGGLEFHGILDDIGDAIAGGAETVVDVVVSAGDAIAEGFSKVGDFVMPDWLVGVWDSIKMFISNLDLGSLISDPSGYLEDMIKKFSDFLVEPARKMMGFADGGFVPGFGTGDTVPAMLTPGEFVINRGAAQNLGAGLLNQLNGGMMPAMAGAGQAPVFNINLNIETSEAIDDNYIRNRLIPTIKQEIRSSSLRGEFLVSSKGVR